MNMYYSVLSRLLTAVLSVAFLASALPVLAAPDIRVHEPQETHPQAYAVGEVLVKFKNSKMPFEVISVPNVEAAIVALSKNPNVEFVEPNYVVTAFAVPNDPLYRYQWHLDNSGYGGIEAEEAWDISTGAGVTVAVVDTGLASVTDGPACVLNGYNYVADSINTTDDNGHGTHVSNTIAEATNNGIGGAGVAYGACILPVKVLDASGSGYNSDVASGIRYAADNGAQVINLSLGSSVASQVIEDAVAYAYGKGVTVVAATGNDGRGQVSYPAAYDNYVIAVGATSYDEELASYSNYGSALDIVAPGGEMYTTRGRFTRDNDENGDGYVDGVLQNTTVDGSEAYYFFQGTSMAAPHVAGVAALVLAHGNATTPDEVRAALQESADDLGAAGADTTFGHGLVNAYQALLWEPGAPPANQDPTADFTYGTDGLIVDFTDASNDSDGTLVTWHWSFGDGAESNIQNPQHTYAASGTYSVTLTVTDNDGATAEKTRTVTVDTAVVPPPTAIELSYTLGKMRSNKYVSLTWTPAMPAVNVYRDGQLIETNNATGVYTDNLGKSSGTRTYTVCETVNTTSCSNEVTVRY